MSGTLLLTLRFHDGRYHGTPDWPPSPARLFQALVAGAARGRALDPADREGLLWLEGLSPPVIAAPAVRDGQGFRTYVPNNDLDAKGGDPRRVAEVRAPKSIRPRLFDAERSILYLWPLAGEEHRAAAICRIATHLYQLGRGVDMAYASGEVVEAEEAEERLLGHAGPIYRPTPAGGDGRLLACPVAGTLASLEARFAAMAGRFTTMGKGKQRKTGFAQPPKPRTALCSYDCPPDRFLFDLRRTDSGQAVPPFVPHPLESIVALTEHLRDQAVDRLAGALPMQRQAIERLIAGRGAENADKPLRLRLLPLPSIGHPNAEASIRRLLVEVPPDCPLDRGDIRWAFSDPDPHDPGTGELLGWSLVPAGDRGMLRHYGIEGGMPARVWRSITPLVLPLAMTGRGKVAADRGGAARRAREERMALAVGAALRHAGITAPVDAVRVQKEPFLARGIGAEAFAAGTRFHRNRLRHVEIRFAEPLGGPLVLGDGRYLGLGLMAPVASERPPDILAFTLPADSAIGPRDRPALLQAARRALMALARDERGNLHVLFSGHEPAGGPARSGQHRHVFLAADAVPGADRIIRILVAAPWLCDRSVTPTGPERREFDRVVSRLREVRAGRLGLLKLDRPVSPVAGDPMLGPARNWTSLTPYRPTRHARAADEVEAMAIRDLEVECVRRGLPRPTVSLLRTEKGSRGGLRAWARLGFARPVQGPLLLGKDSHMGGGQFAVDD